MLHNANKPEIPDEGRRDGTRMIGKVINYNQWEYRITEAPYINEGYVVAHAECEDEEYVLKWELNEREGQDDLIGFCSYWPIAKVSPKTPGKLEYEIEGFNTLRDFIKELSEEFRMTRFDVVLPLIDYSSYHYNVELSLEDEASYDKVSKIDLYVNYNMSWGSNERTTRNGELELHWTTGSHHTVAITGEWGEGSESWASFKVVLGDDLSRGFYPTVREILRKYASDGNDA